MCVWGIRTARCPTEQAYRRDGEERVVTEREPEPYTQLYQRTEWAPQQSGRENEKEPEVHQCKRLRRGALQLCGQFGTHMRPSKKWGHWGDSSVGIAFAIQK